MQVESLLLMRWRKRGILAIVIVILWLLKIWLASRVEGEISLLQDFS